MGHGLSWRSAFTRNGEWTTLSKTSFLRSDVRFFRDHRFVLVHHQSNINSEINASMRFNLMKSPLVYFDHFFSFLSFSLSISLSLTHTQTLSHSLCTPSLARVPLDINFLHSLRLCEPLFFASLLRHRVHTLHRRPRPNEIIPAPIRLGWDFSPLCNTPAFFFFFFLNSPSNEGVRGSRRNCYWHNTGGSCILNPFVGSYSFFFSFSQSPLVFPPLAPPGEVIGHA